MVWWCGDASLLGPLPNEEEKAAGRYIRWENYRRCVWEAAENRPDLKL